MTKNNQYCPQETDQRSAMAHSSTYVMSDRLKRSSGDTDGCGCTNSSFFSSFGLACARAFRFPFVRLLLRLTSPDSPMASCVDVTYSKCGSTKDDASSAPPGWTTIKRSASGPSLCGNEAELARDAAIRSHGGKRKRTAEDWRAAGAG